MPSWTFDKAPTWAPDAVATDRGWVDKKTGEVLVSCKKLTKAVPYESLFEKGGKPKKKGRGGARPGAGRPRKDAVKVEEPKQEEPKVEEPKVETPKVEEPKAESKPPAKKAPAKKKATTKRKPRSKSKVTKPKAEVKKDDE